MSLKIINAESIKKQRVADNYTSRAMLFIGDKEQNLDAKVPDIRKEWLVEMGSENWVGSKAYHDLWYGPDGIAELQKKLPKEQNMAQPPSQTLLESLFGKIFLDITRRVQDGFDLTPLIATEITNLDFGRTVNLREIYDFVGYFAEIEGSGDSVKLIQQATGTTDTVDMQARGLGWAQSLINLLYDDLYTIEKVIRAASQAYIDMRNSKTAGVIIGATYVASQKQAADATGSTYDTKMYNTWRKAIKKIRGLKDYRGDQIPINIPSLSILCNSYDTWSIARAIQGQLQSSGGKGSGDVYSMNLAALPIDSIIEYDRGMTHGKTWGKKTLSYPGVTAGTAYLFVPREYFWVLNKRPLTMETGRGSVLTLSQEERAWYNIQAEFYKIFLGSSYDGTALGASFGAVLEVTLPTDS